jgi:MinD-like ATPase involved in chromosome partitioning or flagellar assembly
MLKLVVHSNKGGPGKSTIASSLAVCLSLAGKRVGIIDMDLSGPGLHVIFGLSKKDLKYTLSDVLQKKCTPRQATVDLTSRLGIKKGKLVFVPGAFKTESIVSLMRKGYELATLRKAINEVVSAHALDYLIVDIRPGIDESTMLAIGLCDAMILVTRVDRQYLLGTEVTLEVARAFKKQVLLVVNMIPSGVEKKKLEKTFASMFHISIAAMIPYYVDVHNNLSTGVFVLKRPEHEFSSKMRSLTQEVMKLKPRPETTERMYASTPLALT